MTGPAIAAPVAVALLDGRVLADALAQRTGLRVVATGNDDHRQLAAALAEDHGLVVGLATVPWPVAHDLHAACSESVAGYTGVVSWHALPALHEALAGVVAPAVRAGAHMLVTAPDPGPASDPDDLVFLREVAAGIAGHLPGASTSIAWRGATRTPTAADALASVVEVHGRRDVVECPVAPGTTADGALEALARRLGARLSCADLGQQALVSLLATVVTTVSRHEQTGASAPAAGGP